MEILAIIGVISVIGILFTGGGLLGWILEGFSKIIELLFEGNMNCIGCFFRILFWLFVIALVISII